MVDTILFFNYNKCYGLLPPPIRVWLNIMEIFMSKNVKQKMLAVLTKKDGYNTFTTAQARARFGIKNVAARISELREEGYAIYSNTKKLADGRTITVYRLGQPSRRMIAEGIKALKAKGVSTFA